jgi:regulator of sirC expression with transglutaminase-like and TPR domain
MRKEFGRLNRHLVKVAALMVLLGSVSCNLPSGDPASTTLAIVSKHPATFTERLVALDAMVRRYHGLEPMPSLAESLMSHQSRLKNAWRKNLDSRQTMNALRDFMYDSLIISPKADSIGLKFSLPSEILISRQGSCVGLVLLFLVYAEALNIPLRPVFLPGHLTLRLDQGDSVFFLETLKPRVNRDSLFYRNTFRLESRPWYASLNPMPPSDALFALAFNLANDLRNQGKWDWASDLFQIIENHLPGFPEASGNLGLLLNQMGRTQESRVSLQKALTGDSLAGKLPQLGKESLLDSSSH